MECLYNNRYKEMYKESTDRRIDIFWIDYDFFLIECDGTTFTFLASTLEMNKRDYSVQSIWGVE